MSEKITDRIGVISLALYTILFFAQPICVGCNVNLTIQIILFVIYNLCIGGTMMMYFPEENKMTRLLKAIVTMLVADAVVIIACLIVYGIKMIF